MCLNILYGTVGTHQYSFIQYHRQKLEILMTVDNQKSLRLYDPCA